MAEEQIYFDDQIETEEYDVALEDFHFIGTTLSSKAAANTAAKIAFIKTDADFLDEEFGVNLFDPALTTFSQHYENSLNQINSGKLYEIERDLTKTYNNNLQQSVRDEAIQKLQKGENVSELSKVLNSYVEADSRNIQKGVIEEMFYTKLIDRAAAHPENAALYRSMISLQEEGDTLQQFHELNRKYLKLSSLMSKYRKDREDQPWYTGFAEFFGNLTPGKTDHMLMNLVETQTDQGIIDFVKNLIGKRPTDYVKTIREQMQSKTPEEFDAWFEKFAYVLEETSGVSGVNEAAVEDIIDLISQSSDQDLLIRDIFSVTDIAELPATKAMRMFLKVAAPSKASVLKSTGNTDLAAKITESTVDPLPNTPAVLKETSVETAVDNMMPTGAKATDDLIGEPSITHEVLDRMKFHQKLKQEISLILASGRRVTQERMEELQEKLKDAVEKEFGTSFVSDFGFKPNAQGVVDQFEFLIGKAKGGGFDKESVAKQQISKKFGKDNPDYETYMDPTNGQWYIKGKRDLQETFVVDENLANGIGGLVGGMLRSATAILPEWLGGKAMVAQFDKVKLMSAIKPIIRDAIAISKSQKERVNALMIMSNQTDTYYDIKTFVSKYREKFKVDPTNEEILSYQSYVKLNDISWTFNNFDLFIDLHTKGYVSGKLLTKDIDLSVTELGPIKQIKNLQDTSNMLIFDTTDNALHTGRSKGYGVGDIREKLDANTHELYELRNSYNDANFILVRKGELNQQNLNWQVLSYKKGFQREYDGKYFVKQAREIFVEGKKVGLDPKTFAVGKTLKEAQRYADNLNEALDIYRNTKVSQRAEFISKLQDLGFEGGFEEIENKIKRNILNSNYKFQVVFDKDTLPLSNFNPDQDILAVTRRPAHELFLEDRGSLIYSRRGRIKKSANDSDELALLVDPTETTAKVLQMSLGKASIANYRATALNQWMTSYGKYLKARPGLSREQILMAGVRANDFRAMPSELQKKALQSALAIQNQLRTNSEYGNLWRSAIKNTAKLVGGKSEWANKFVLNYYSKDPVTFMRTLAFDTKLGLFNLDQLFLQINTAASIAAMDPVNAPRLFQDGMHLFLASFSPHKDVHNFVSKRFFDNPKEAQAMINIANETGVLKVGGEFALFDHATLNFDMPNSVSGAFGTVRELGRVIFYNAEKFNRSVAFAKGFKELVKDKGLDFVQSNQGKEQLRFLTDKYTMSMTSMSSARWQKGLLSVPTQFLSYPLRVWENILPVGVGGNPNWKGQKTRLFLSMLGLYGASTIPFGQEMTFYMLQKLGIDEEENKEAYRLMLGGLADGVLAWGLGMDSTQSNRAGIGIAIQDIINRLRGEDFAATSTLGMFSGPSIQIGIQLYNSGLDALSLMYEGIMADNATLQDTVDIGLDAINQFAKENITSWGRFSQTMWALNTGYHVSNRTSGKLDQVDLNQTLGLLLGLRPFDMSIALLKDKSTKEYQTYLNDQAKTLKRFHRERTLALESGDIEKYRQINKNIAILQSGLRYEEDRLNILKRTFPSTDKTFVQAITNQFNRDLKIPQKLRELD